MLLRHDEKPHRKALVLWFELQAELAAVLFRESSFLLERSTEDKLIIQTWEIGKCHKNEHVASRKMKSVSTKDKTWAYN